MMTKLKTAALLLLSGTLLFSCKNNSNDEPVNLEEGSAYAGLYLSTNPESSLKAQADYAGRLSEQKLATLDLISSVQNQTWTFSDTPEEDGKVWKSGDFYTVNPWKTKEGTQIMALVVNKNDLSTSIGTAKNQIFGSLSNAKANIDKLAKEDNFVMTSNVLTKSIKPDISEDAVKGVTSSIDESKNVFAFEVERVVAQGLVAKDAELGAETLDGKGVVDLDGLKYAAINGAVKTYLFRDNAGKRTLANNMYNDFKSAIDGELTSFEDAKDPNAAKDVLIRLGNIAQDTNDNLGAYKAIPVAENETAAKGARGIYFLENSVDKTTTWTPENKNKGFYRLAYAKVYATFTPKKVFAWDEESKKMNEKTIKKSVTFYKGEDDGLLYDSKESAKHSATSPDQKAYTYKDGKCFYRALWNRQEDGKSLANADVRRNNIYLIKIKAFQGLGAAWDPSDPSDPNLPKPTDPNEPTNPENPDVEKQDTYMKVNTIMLQWNLVDRTVTLD